MADLETIQKKILSFRNERDWAQFHDPKNLAEALAIRVGHCSITSSSLKKRNLLVSGLILVCSPAARVIRGGSMPENIYKSIFPRPIDKLAARVVDANNDDNISEDDIIGVKLACDEIVASKNGRHKKRYKYIYQMIIDSKGSKRNELLKLIKNHRILRLPAGVSDEHSDFMKKWEEILRVTQEAIEKAKKQKSSESSEPFKLSRPPVIPPELARKTIRKKKRSFSNAK